MVYAHLIKGQPAVSVLICQHFIRFRGVFSWNTILRVAVECWKMLSHSSEVSKANIKVLVGLCPLQSWWRNPSLSLLQTWWSAFGVLWLTDPLLKSCFFKACHLHFCVHVPLYKNAGQMGVELSNELILIWLVSKDSISQQGWEREQRLCLQHVFLEKQNSIHNNMLLDIHLKFFGVHRGTKSPVNSGE